MGRKKTYNWDEIIALYTGGLTVEEVSQRTGMSKAGVINVLRRCGIDTRRQQKGINYEQLYQEHLAGKSLTDLSKEHGVAVSTISQCFKYRGYLTRRWPKGTKTE